jgi:hypothetical protein
MFTLECLHEHVPVFLELVKQRNDGLLKQLTVTPYEYHSEVIWDVPTSPHENIILFQAIDMNDILLNLRCTQHVYTLRVLAQPKAYINEYVRYITQNLRTPTYLGESAKEIPKLNWKEQQELHRIKLLLDITG